MSLSEIKNQLLEYSTFQCAMMHEKLVFEKETGLPERNIIGDETHFKRFGFRSL